jgi:hypothetical protein
MKITTLHIDFSLNSPIFRILLYFLSFTIAYGTLAAQNVLDNSGQIFNGKTGVIRVKRGEVKGMPDSIGGRVEFLAPTLSGQQSVPNIIYNQLVIGNKATKIIRDEKDINNKVRNLVVLDSLIIEDSTVLTTGWIGINSPDVHAKGAVVNTAKYKGPKDVRMNNDTAAQDLHGNGRFSRLNIDNPFGVNVHGGGFAIEEKLTLSRGQLRNAAAPEKIVLEDSVLIERHSGASIQVAPQFGANVSVHYAGNGEMIQGPEIPLDTSVLHDLRVENVGGLVLDTNVFVNNELFLSSYIKTEPTDERRYILTLNSEKEPVFATSNAEIDGSVRRNVLKVGEKMLFNNIYTYAYFPDETAKNGTRSLIFRTKPYKYSPLPDGSINKVMRHFALEARDADDRLIQSGVTITFGYGWRYTPSTPTTDEVKGLDLSSLKLMRYLDNKWNEFTNSSVPQFDVSTDWAFANVEGITPYGDFAIGFPSAGLLLLSARAYLEGPYRNGSMAADLKEKNLIPLTPPDIYPYNMDPQRTSYTVLSIPDSVVDWILVEFRTQMLGGESRYRIGFLSKNGAIVDLDGVSPLRLKNSTLGNIDSGDYYIAVHHRSHLAVITGDPIHMYPSAYPTSVDFTNPAILFGQATAVKPLHKFQDNSLLYGMIAGDINGDGIINNDDYIGVWDVISDPNNTAADNFDYLNADLTLSGNINTRDWNYTWNNRGRSTNVPKKK